MKHRLETISAVLVLLVIVLAWFNGREQPSQPVAASPVEGETPGAQALPAGSAARSPLKHSDVTCTKERDAKLRRVSGGMVEEDFARVYFRSGDHPTEVKIIPVTGLHGISLSQVPSEMVLVFLRLDYCHAKETKPYFFHTGDGYLPAYIVKTGWRRQNVWAVAEVAPGNLNRDTASVPQTGFVILSN